MHTVTIVSAHQAKAVMRSAYEFILRRVAAERPVRLTISDDKRTLPQNAHIHPVVRRLAEQLGRAKDPESLRRLRYLLLEQWRSETGRAPLFERSMDGLRWVEVSTGTSDLDKPDCAEFLDWMLAQDDSEQRG